MLDHLSENPSAVPLTRSFYAGGPADDDEDWDLDDIGVPADDSTTAAEVMTAEVVVVSPTTTVDEAMDRLDRLRAELVVTFNLIFNFL